MAIPTPEDWFTKLLRRPYAYDLPIAYFALIAGAGTICRIVKAPTWATVLLFSVAATGVFLFSIAKIVVQWNAANDLESTHELEGCLQTLLAVLEDSPGEAEPNPRLRLTVHKHNADSQQLVQLLEYIGDDRGGRGKVLRKLPDHAGAIGHCATDGIVIYGSRTNADIEAYVRELKKKWGYTSREAEQRDPLTMSWMAVPLKLPNGLLDAVVYLDSTQPDFFDDKQRRRTIQAACAGIACFVDSRYPNA